jgi:hypothetical protein
MALPRGGRFVPKVLHAMVQHTWETTLSHQSSLVVSGHVMALNGIGSGTITPTYRHVFSPFLWVEVSANLGLKSSVSTKPVKNFTEDM